MSDDNLPAKPTRGPNRAPPTKLNVRMKRIIAYMVYGRDDDPTRTPLSVEDAAQLVGYQRKAGRQLLDVTIFVQEYNRLLAVYRSGEAARSVATMVELRDDKGDSSAATKTVRLKAARSILGEDRAGGVNVQINNSNRLYTPGGVLGGGQPTALGTPVVPGYILDLREPHELDVDDPDYVPLTIEVTPTSQPALHHSPIINAIVRPSVAAQPVPAKPAQPGGFVEYTDHDLRHMTAEQLLNKRSR